METEKAEDEEMGSDFFFFNDVLAPPSIQNSILYHNHDNCNLFYDYLEVYFSVLKAFFSFSFSFSLLLIT